MTLWPCSVSCDVYPFYSLVGTKRIKQFVVFDRSTKREEISRNKEMSNSFVFVVPIKKEREREGLEEEKKIKQIIL